MMLFKSSIFMTAKSRSSFYRRFFLSPQLKCFSDPMLVSLEDLLSVDSKSADERRDVFIRFLKNEVDYSDVSVFHFLMNFLKFSQTVLNPSMTRFLCILSS